MKEGVPYSTGTLSPCSLSQALFMKRTRAAPVTFLANRHNDFVSLILNSEVTFHGLSSSTSLLMANLVGEPLHAHSCTVQYIHLCPRPGLLESTYCLTRIYILPSSHLLTFCSGMLASACQPRYVNLSVII